MRGSGLGLGARARAGIGSSFLTNEMAGFGSNTFRVACVSGTSRSLDPLLLVLLHPLPNPNAIL
jgi:hypothetical protein